MDSRRLPKTSDIRIRQIMSNSQPDLSILSDDESKQARKRKQRDCCDVVSELSDFRTEITSLLDRHLTLVREDISSVKIQITEIKNTTSLMLEEQNKIKSQVSELFLFKDDTQSNLAELRKENKILNEKVLCFEKDLTEVNNCNKLLSDKLRLSDQQGRLNNLEISGIPYQNGENLQNYLSLIAAKVGFSLVPSDIDYIHRVRRYPHQNSKKSVDNTQKEEDTSMKPNAQIPNIIVRFTQRHRKNDMIAAVRARRGLTTADVGIAGAARPIFVNDHLAPHNKMLYGRARRAGHELGYKYIWLNDCKIFLRKSDTSKAILISTESDLTKIK